VPAAPAPPPVPSLPSNVSSIHINNEKVIIGLKDGKLENYDLNKPEEKQAFEKKYGDLVPATPKPPAAPKAPIAPVKPIAVSTMTVVGLEPVVTVEKTEPVIQEPVVQVATTVSAEVIDLQPTVTLESPIEHNILIAEVTKQTSMAQLEQLKKQLLQKGYKLSVNSTSYVDGVLKSIEGTITDENSKARFMGQEFNKILITKVTYENGKSAFHIRIIDGIIKM
jgi:hypothetical protein